MADKVTTLNIKSQKVYIEGGDFSLIWVPCHLVEARELLMKP